VEITTVFVTVFVAVIVSIFVLASDPHTHGVVVIATVSIDIVTSTVGAIVVIVLSVVVVSVVIAVLISVLIAILVAIVLVFGGIIAVLVEVGVEVVLGLEGAVICRRFLEVRNELERNLRNGIAEGVRLELPSLAVSVRFDSIHIWEITVWEFRRECWRIVDVAEIAGHSNVIDVIEPLEVIIDIFWVYFDPFELHVDVSLDIHSCLEVAVHLLTI
jgi:hypothetical protein